MDNREEISINNIEFKRITNQTHKLRQVVRIPKRLYIISIVLLFLGGVLIFLGFWDEFEKH